MFGEDECPNCDGDGWIETVCGNCGGSGSLPGGDRCPNCTGFSTGPDGSLVEDCRRCNGTGKL